MRNKTEKRLTCGVLIILLLSCCLTVTTFALAYAIVKVEDNVFLTGTVKINLNDGKTVIDENEFLFEPGMTVKKDFFISNESSCSVYYKLYFADLSGGLADVLQVRICDGSKVLFAGTPKALNRAETEACDDMLEQNERRDLQIYFYFPEDAGNEAQNLHLSFSFVAEAVQTKNNTNKNFN